LRRDKSGNVLRIEFTVNDVSQLKVFRDVHHKNGTVSKERAQVEKSIYSLIHIIRFGKADTKRYLDFLSKISRLLKRLIVFNLVKRIKHTYKYFLAETGRIIITMFLKLRNLTVIPLFILFEELSPSFNKS